jgi:hypothetical protein
MNDAGLKEWTISKYQVVDSLPGKNECMVVGSEAQKKSV